VTAGKPASQAPARQWTPTEGGRHLRGRQQKNTGPELALRRAMHARGWRFRLHRNLAPGCNPDVVMPASRVAIWVDGCFWHGHATHAPAPSKGPNADLWNEKLAANRARDARAVALAANLGWTPIRIWECAIAQRLDEVLGRLETARSRADSARPRGGPRSP
jgi:DNA mismatch endonuclease (patch repair protein)